LRCEGRIIFFGKINSKIKTLNSKKIQTSKLKAIFGFGDWDFLGVLLFVF
jgi:hypothetical protein